MYHLFVICVIILEIKYGDNNNFVQAQDKIYSKNYILCKLSTYCINYSKHRV